MVSRMRRTVYMSFHRIEQWTFRRFVSFGSAFESMPVWNVMGNVSRPGTKTRKVFTCPANEASVMILVRMSALRCDSRFSEAVGEDRQADRQIDNGQNASASAASPYGCQPTEVDIDPLEEQLARDT